MRNFKIENKEISGMKKILILFVSFLILTSCTDYIQKRDNAETQYKSLELKIDSLTNVEKNCVRTIDSLRAVQRDILSNQESRERNDRLIKERNSLGREINEQRTICYGLTKVNNALKDEIKSNKFNINFCKNIYIISVRIHQTTYSLSISEHVKNKLNDVVFEIPVDKSYYDKCRVGQEVTDAGLKMGSLLRDGDFSKLKITVEGKRMVKR